MQNSEIVDDSKVKSNANREFSEVEQHYSNLEKPEPDMEMNTEAHPESTNGELSSVAVEQRKLQEFPEQTAHSSSPCATIDKREHTSTTAAGQTASNKNKKLGANSYYYWHGHEKERAKVGDVAPLPTPVLVKKDENVLLSPVITSTPITKYSWSDDGNVVTIYVETGHRCVSDNTTAESSKLTENSATMQTEAQTTSSHDDKCEELDLDSVNVKFAKYTCEVNFTTCIPSKNGLQRNKRLFLHLSNKIKPANCSYKVKASLKEVVVKLAKAKDVTWFDLMGKDKSSVSSSSSASSQNSDSDNETMEEEEQESSNIT